MQGRTHRCDGYKPRNDNGFRRNNRNDDIDDYRRTKPQKPKVEEWKPISLKKNDLKPRTFSEFNHQDAPTKCHIDMTFSDVRHNAPEISVDNRNTRQRNNTENFTPKRQDKPRRFNDNQQDFSQKRQKYYDYHEDFSQKRQEKPRRYDKKKTVTFEQEQNVQPSTIIHSRSLIDTPPKSPSFEPETIPKTQSFDGDAKKIWRMPEEVKAAKNIRELLESFAKRPLLSLNSRSTLRAMTHYDMMDGKIYPPPKQVDCMIPTANLYSYTQRLYEESNFDELLEVHNTIDLVRRSMTPVYRRSEEEIDLSIICELEGSPTFPLPEFMIQVQKLPNPQDKYYVYDTMKWTIIGHSLLPNGVPLDYLGWSEPEESRLDYISKLYTTVYRLNEFYVNTLASAYREDVFEKADKEKNTEIKRYIDKNIRDDESNFDQIKTECSKLECEFSVNTRNKIKADTEKRVDEYRKVLDDYMNDILSSRDIHDTFKLRTLWRMLTLDVTQCGIEEEVSDIITNPKILLFEHIDNFSNECYSLLIRKLRNRFYGLYSDVDASNYNLDSYNLWLKVNTYLFILSSILEFKNSQRTPKQFAVICNTIWDTLWNIFSHDDYNTIPDDRMQRTNIGRALRMTPRMGNFNSILNKITKENQDYMICNIMSYNPDEIIRTVLDKILSDYPFLLELFVQSVLKNTYDHQIVNKLTTEYVNTNMKHQSENELFWKLVFTMNYNDVYMLGSDICKCFTYLYEMFDDEDVELHYNMMTAFGKVIKNYGCKLGVKFGNYFKDTSNSFISYIDHNDIIAKNEKKFLISDTLEIISKYI